MSQRAITAFLALVFLGGGAVADAAEVKIICANGMRDTVRGLRERLESTTGHKVTMTFGETGDLRRGLQAGDVGDVIILPRTVMEQVLADGKIAPGTTVDLARTEIGAGVRAGAAKSDMTSADGFRRAVLAATAIVITDPASGGVSGVHMADVFRASASWSRSNRS